MVLAPAGPGAPVGALEAPRAVRWASMGTEGAAGRVRRFRRLRGLTQAQLAVGARTDKGYIGALEAGRIAEPSVDVLLRLAEALGVDVRALADPRLYSDAPDWKAALMAERDLDDEAKTLLVRLIERELTLRSPAQPS